MKPINEMSLAEREAHAGHEWKELLIWNTHECEKIQKKLASEGRITGLDGWNEEYKQLKRVYDEKFRQLISKYFGDLPLEVQKKARISPKKMTEKTLKNG